MRSWNKRSIELSLTPREAELLLAWLQDLCTDRSRDGVGFRLVAALKNAVPTAEE